MTHNTKEGKSKIVKALILPISAGGCVNLILTDLAVIEVTPEGLLLKEYAPGWTPEEIQEQTEAHLIVAGDVREIEF